MMARLFSQLRAFLLLPGCAVLIISIPSLALADLSSKEARNLIAKAGGMSLPSSSIRVRKPEMLLPNLAEVGADIDLVFRFGQESSGFWRLKELRTGQGRWEALELIVRALGTHLPVDNCDNRDQFQQRVETELTARTARCLIAALFGVELPSDDVRIKSISGFGLPLASQPSAIAVAQVRIYLQVRKETSGWQLHALKTGSRDWFLLHTFLSSIATIKSDLARDDMKTLAAALEKFRQERGGFLVSDQHEVLIDHLCPRYLAQVIRLDPWENPYHYQGTRDHFSLRSTGPDGKLNTADDVVFTSQ